MPKIHEREAEGYGLQARCAEIRYRSIAHFRWQIAKECRFDPIRSPDSLPSPLCVGWQPGSAASAG